PVAAARPSPPPSPRPDREAPATPAPRRTRAAGDGGARPTDGGAPAAAVADAVSTIRQAAAGLPSAAMPGEAPAEEAPEATAIPEGAPPAELAAFLAGALRRVPGIGRYRDARLEELASRGPRVARTLWERVGPQLGDAYQATTVGDLLDQFES
ncbi:MAG: hypothetical protein ACRDHD_00950, partial [Candidatus Limnocylindria bacterium]